MKLVNQTDLPAAWTVSLAPDGREMLTIVAKATYVLCCPRPAEEPPLAEVQVPLVESDLFGAEPARNATLFEADFAPTKPECDVLLVGSAHAPYGRPVRSLPVRLRVGPISKTFVVTGRRAWQAALLRDIAPGEPQPFVSQPISYDVAFGGIDCDPRHPERVETFLDNPVGRGFRRFDLALAGHPMPVTEEADRPIRDPRERYRPMALGPLGRSWQPRVRHVGTYDQEWLESRVPLMPLDFDPRYYQAAPPDQRMPHPKGKEVIELIHLVPSSLRPDARVTTKLPALALGALVVGMGPPALARANVDTIVLEPDANRFTVTHRATHLLERDAFDVEEIVLAVADRLRSRVRAGLSNKTYYAGLGALVRERNGRVE